MIVAPFWKEDQFKDFLNVILAGGEITFYLKETEYNDRFRFIVRTDGLTEAAKISDREVTILYHQTPLCVLSPFIVK